MEPISADRVQKNNQQRMELASSWMLKQNKSFQKINKEWSVNHSELNFKRELRRGQQYSIHEGQWHGDVFIYKLNLQQQQQLQQHSASCATFSTRKTTGSCWPSCNVLSSDCDACNCNLVTTSALSTSSSVSCYASQPNSTTSLQTGEVFSFQLNDTTTNNNTTSAEDNADSSNNSDTHNGGMNEDNDDDDDDDDVFVKSPSRSTCQVDERQPASFKRQLDASRFSRMARSKLTSELTRLDSAYSSLSSLDQCSSPTCCRAQQWLANLNQQQLESTISNKQHQTASRQRQVMNSATFGQSALAAVTLLREAATVDNRLVDSGWSACIDAIESEVQQDQKQSQQQQQQQHQQQQEDNRWRLKLESTVRFYDDLVNLCSVAHENFVLFMGASLDIDNLSCSIIMGKCNGPTLYECIHKPEFSNHQRLNNNQADYHRLQPFKSRYHSMDVNNKRNIIHQIAMGMAYLHGKDMIHGNLNSVNIILDYRVKICLIDHNLIQVDQQPTGCVNLTRGQLTYMSPELLRQLCVNCCTGSTSTVQFAEQHCGPTKESDIFALGTIMYELFCGQFPFAGATSDEIIWRSGSGNSCHNELFNNNNSQLMNEQIETLIKQCWSFHANQRPTFSDIIILLDIPNDADNSQHKSKDINSSADDDGTSSYFSYSSSSSSSSSYKSPLGRRLDWPAPSPLTPTSRSPLSRLQVGGTTSALQQFNSIKIMKKQRNSPLTGPCSSKESMF